MKLSEESRKTDSSRGGGTQHGRTERGSTLAITLLVIAILSVSLAGYLKWLQTETRLTARSQTWNTALACAEAGVEEAMAQVNSVFGTNYIPSTYKNWGGGLSAGYFGPRTNGLSCGSYSAIILPEAGAPGPTIISTGYATVQIDGRILTRTVKVTTRADTAFGSAITVRSNLTTKGTGLTVDSYDSADPEHSTNGMYNPLTRKAGGDVNSVGGLIDVQNAEIYGKLRTGPEGSFSIGNGSVGDLDWNVKGQIQPGWYANDFNAEVKDVLPPYTTGLDVPVVDYKTNKYYVVGTGDWLHPGDFVMSQNEIMVVYGNARVYVTGNFNMKSQNACEIRIMPGASLKLYVGTESGPDVSGALTLVNTSGDASTFQYYGLPSNNSLSWVGNNVYVGTVYAPEATITMGGGGSSYFDYQGACVCDSATLNGHFNVHYDENLARLPLATGFRITSWREL